MTDDSRDPSSGSLVHVVEPDAKNDHYFSETPGTLAGPGGRFVPLPGKAKEVRQVCRQCRREVGPDPAPQIMRGVRGPAEDPGAAPHGLLSPFGNPVPVSGVSPDRGQPATGPIVRGGGVISLSEALPVVWERIVERARAEGFEVQPGEVFTMVEFAVYVSPGGQVRSFDQLEPSWRIDGVIQAPGTATIQNGARSGRKMLVIQTHYMDRLAWLHASEAIDRAGRNEWGLRWVPAGVTQEDASC